MSELATAIKRSYIPAEVYAERDLPIGGAANRILSRIEGFFVPKFMHWELKKLQSIVGVAERWKSFLADCDDEELQNRAREAAIRLRTDFTSSENAGEVFAIIREASGRVLNMRHHDVQLLADLQCCGANWPR